MPDTPDRPTHHHHTTGVDLLDRAFDTAAPVSVSAPPDGALDPDLIATIDTLRTMHARSTPPGPDAAFVARLREDLMHASPLPLATPTPSRLPVAAGQRTPAPKPRFTGPIPAWATSGVGAFSTILTIGVAIALIVASVGWWDRAGTPPPPTPSEVAFAAATPPPSPTITLSMSDTGFSPAVLDVPPGTPATAMLAITNAGSRSYRFRIPALGVSADIPAGETRSVGVTLSPGVFAFFVADSTAIGDGLHGQLTVPVGIGQPLRQSLEAAQSDATLWSNDTVTMKARPASDARPLGTYPAGMGFQPVSISGDTLGDSEATVTWMRWTLVSLPGASEIGWIETGHLTATKPAYALSTPVVATPVAAIDVPPVSTAGGPGRSWRLSDTDPRTDGLPRQIAADVNLAVMSALVVGDSIVVSGTDTTSQYGMGEIRRIDLRTGATLWRVPAKPRGDLAAQGDLLYTFTVDRKKVSRLKLRVSAFSLSTGEEVWTGPELDVGSDTLAGYGPVLLDGMLYATDPAGNTIALDPATGATAWQYPATPVAFPVTAKAGSSMLAVQGDTEPWVFVTTTEGKIVRLSGITGEVRATTDAHTDAQSLTLLAADNRDLFVAYFPAKGGDGAGIDRLTAATLKSPATLDGFDFTANPIPEPGGSLLASTAAMIDGEFVTTLGRIMPSDDQRQRLGDAASLDIGPLPHIDTMSLAGDTVMGLTGDGDLVFVNVETREVTQGAVPVAAARTALRLRPLLWGDVPVIVAGDGTIWAMDGTSASGLPDQAGPVMAFTDAGFSNNAYAATTDDRGVVTITLRNDGTESRIITIPSLGIDAHLPSGTAITVRRSAIPSGIVAVFSHTIADVDPTPGFFAQLSLAGTPPPATARMATSTEGVYSTIAYQQVEPGTSVLAIPGDEASVVTIAGRGGTVMPLSVGEPPSNGTARVTDANGVRWTLVLVGANTIGWVPSSALSPLDSDQVLIPTPTPDASPAA